MWFERRGSILLCALLVDVNWKKLEEKGAVWKAMKVLSFVKFNDSEIKNWTIDWKKNAAFCVLLSVAKLLYLSATGVLKSSFFWPRFYIVVLGMTFFFFSQFTFSNFYLDYFSPFLFGLLFPFFPLLFPFPIWTFFSKKISTTVFP